MAGYAVLGAFFVQWQVIALAVPLAWGYGALIEAIQAWLPYRSAETADLAMNAAGVIAGVLAVLLGPRINRRPG